MANNTDSSPDGRAIQQCKYCSKYKAPLKMSSRHICRECSNASQKVHQTKLREDLREERCRTVDVKNYPLSQSWANLANVVAV